VGQPIDYLDPKLPAALAWLEMPILEACDPGLASADHASPPQRMLPGHANYHPRRRGSLKRLGVSASPELSAEPFR